MKNFFKFTKLRVFIAILMLILIFTLQYFLVGSLLSMQKVTTEAGNSASAVIGILDETPIVRQKFSFDRDITMESLTLSFGSFKAKEVGDTVHLQIRDGNNNVVMSKDVSVKKIHANSTYTCEFDNRVYIPKESVCCLHITCSSKDIPYASLPTLNTTNRTDPNTYMSTLSQQTHKKSLNISYTYTYGQIYPFIVMIFEVLLVIFLIFEGFTWNSIQEIKEELKKRKRFLSSLFKKKKKDADKEEDDSEADEKSKEKAEKKVKETSKDKLKAANDKDAESEKEESFDENADSENEKPDKTRVIKNKIIKNILGFIFSISFLKIIIIILNPYVLCRILEMMNGTAKTIKPNVWIFTWILLLAVEFLMLAVIRNVGVAMIIMDIALFLCGFVNLVVLNVRGTPFLPADILGIQTATEVADHYTISLTPSQFVVLVAFIIWLIVLIKLSKFKVKFKLSTYVGLFLIKAVPALCVINLLYNTSVLEDAGIKDNVWNKVSSCKTNGFYMNFFINLHYLKVASPDGYSQDKIIDIVDAVKDEEVVEKKSGNDSLIIKNDSNKTSYESGGMTTNADFTTNTVLDGKKPNIILIMNESLADFSLVNNTVSFNKDPLPYIHSMKENTIKGIDYVSVFGAGTSNSEFEAMTGNTMKFFPSGSNVYQQFTHKSTFSLPSYLKELGYECLAVHPSSGTNWNRVNAYTAMDFDEFITIDNFKNPEYIRYISDKESYKKVIEQFENKKKGKPLYVFDMTIQNHGGYLTNTDWDDPIKVSNAYYTETDEFLSSTHVSDEAFEYLIDYFNEYSEPTIICMFGDHFPSVETEFYEQILGKESSEWDLNDIQKRFGTPFILWANYDIPETDSLSISNNYLENLLLKQSGLELPIYNKYIEQVSKVIPAMNVNGYMDYNGEWHYYDKSEPDDVSELLDSYELLQYAYYSDTDKDKMSKIFDMSTKRDELIVK
ncbi:MAG: LTA synthase family protein [Lachnospiraceae bacterium]|nr:LTA synthase family protein [Lachnospiraceae bacterium]